MKNLDVWQFIHRSLGRNEPTALLAVVQSDGPSPGRAGFKLALNASGEHHGTIGGGIMEATWISNTLQALRDGSLRQSVHHLHHAKETRFEPSGLICSGSQVLVVYPLTGGDLNAVGRILNAFETHSSIHVRLTPNALEAHEPDNREAEHSFLEYPDGSWQYEELAGILDVVYVIGSGHVGKALCRILATLDVHVVAIDDRPAVDTFVTNTFAHSKFVMPYAELATAVQGTGREYAAIVTTAYPSDEAALKAIINKNLRYIGLMGSEAKTRKILDDLMREGISAEQLKHVRWPIGLPIQSHTPEEIAISIAAEIIKERNALRH